MPLAHPPSSWPAVAPACATLLRPPVLPLLHLVVVVVLPPPFLVLVLMQVLVLLLIPLVLVHLPLLLFLLVLLPLLATATVPLLGLAATKSSTTCETTYIPRINNTIRSTSHPQNEMFVLFSR
jgi:hypothetical protein